MRPVNPKVIVQHQHQEWQPENETAQPNATRKTCFRLQGWKHHEARLFHWNATPTCEMGHWDVLQTLWSNLTLGWSNWPAEWSSDFAHKWAGSGTTHLQGKSEESCEDWHKGSHQVPFQCHNQQPSWPKKGKSEAKPIGITWWQFYHEAPMSRLSNEISWKRKWQPSIDPHEPFCTKWSVLFDTLQSTPARMELVGTVHRSLGTAFLPQVWFHKEEWEKSRQIHVSSTIWMVVGILDRKEDLGESQKCHHSQPHVWLPVVVIQPYFQLHRLHYHEDFPFYWPTPCAHLREREWYQPAATLTYALLCTNVPRMVLARMQKATRMHTRYAVWKVAKPNELQLCRFRRAANTNANQRVNGWYSANPMLMLLPMEKCNVDRMRTAECMCEDLLHSTNRNPIRADDRMKQPVPSTAWCWIQLG